MCRQAGTCTEHAARNSKIIRSRRSSYRHLRIVFHAAYLTAAIDVTVHRTGTDADIRSVSNCFLTPPCVRTSLACSKHIAISECTICTYINTSTYRTTRDGHRTDASVLVILSDSVIVWAIVIVRIHITAITITIFPYIIVTGIRLINRTHVAQVTTTIDVAINDSATTDRESGVSSHSPGFCI